MSKKKTSQVFDTCEVFFFILNKISNLKSQISNLRSQISNLAYFISGSGVNLK